MSKIVIDAGHGKNVAGKRCLKSLDPNETRELVLNDRVADALETYLLSAGHATLRVDDISGNTDVPLATRVKMANEWKADYYASIHHNAGINGGTGGGTIVFAYPGTSGNTIKTQEAIYRQAIARAGLKGNRADVIKTADFYALMPPDNATTIALGTDVSFPQDGPNSGSEIERTGPSSFNPAGNATALTITPLAGGTRPVSAHLVIIQLQ